MKIESILWERVTVTYKEPVGRDHKSVDVYENAHVALRDGGLMIRSYPANPANQRNIILAKPTLIEMQPWSMKWEAFFWETDMEPGSDFNLTSATVICEF